MVNIEEKQNLFKSQLQKGRVSTLESLRHFAFLSSKGSTNVKIYVHYGGPK